MYRQASVHKQAPFGAQTGFTLLEVLLVLFILGMLAALVVPALGQLDDHERARLTRERMELIRRAVLGPDDRFDAEGRRIVGGYVGDMRAWPDLWEARAENKPSFSGTGWEDPDHLAAGLGQGPDYTVDSALVYFRPSGRFVKKRWRWHMPYRRLYDDSTNNADHIGGLETENEGQPRGLWTRYPEELPFDIGSHAAPGLDLGDNWKGPYLTPPSDGNLADGGHWAESDVEYDGLEPLWHNSGAHANFETWEEGSYDPAGELGEHFDEKESFRLLQGDGRLVDGWGRALRFFITADPDHAGGTIFWMLSEGPDQKGTYPSKGTCASHAWSVDATDVMATAYDDEDEKNLDNIVVKLYSRDWEALFAAEQAQKKELTRAALEAIRKALVGASPDGLDSGFTGGLTRWPRLFRWEGSCWDDENDDATPVAYTKGQPRGLWTSKPNAGDSGDDLQASQWGLGWRHAYLKAPVGGDGDQVVTDAWGREILFFHDASHGLWLILSRGADGLFDFGDTDTLPEGSPDGADDYQEPASFTEAVDVTGYDAAATANADNCHIVVAESDWRPGFFRLPQLTVYDATAGTTKARFFRSDGAVSGVDLLTATTLVDGGDGDGNDDWVAGDGTVVAPAFNYDDASTPQSACGARYLVAWNDSDGDDIPDSGENGVAILYNLTAVPGSGRQEALKLDADDFAALP